MSKKVNLHHERLQSTAEIMEAFQMSERTLRGYVARGLPHTKEGKELRFNEKEVAAWRVSNNLTGTRGKPKGPTSARMEKAKLRKELALAERHELGVAKEKGQVIEREKVEAENCRKFTTIRNKLEGLPAAIAPRLEGLAAPEIEQLLAMEIREALAELSRQ